MASRRPSPNRLNPRTTKPIASPGKIEIQGAVRRKSRPSEIMDPQDGVGGWAPRPMNESAASRRIALAIPSVTATTAGEDLGSLRPALARIASKAHSLTLRGQQACAGGSAAGPPPP